MNTRSAQTRTIGRASDFGKAVPEKYPSGYEMDKK
jgi:hypothetical protein